MADQRTPRPAFYIHLIDDFSTTLRLPTSFVRKHLQFMPKFMKLRVKSGLTWDVKIEAAASAVAAADKWFFTAGWNQFVADLELQHMKIAAFSLSTGDAIFDVTPYSADHCEIDVSAYQQPEMIRVDPVFIYEKSPSADADMEERSSSDSVFIYENLSDSDGDDSEESASKFESRPRFEVDLTEWHRSILYVHKEFVEAANLKGEEAVVLQFPPKERYWPVLLQQREIKLRGRNLLCLHKFDAGWPKFRTQNELVYGRTYSFEFDRDKNVILVTEKKE